MILIAIATVLSFFGMMATVAAGMLCYDDLKRRDTLLRQQANVLRRYMDGMLVMWAVVFGLTLYALSHTAV